MLHKEWERTSCSLTGVTGQSQRGPCAGTASAIDAASGIVCGESGLRTSEDLRDKGVANKCPEQAALGFILASAPNSACFDRSALAGVRLSPAKFGAQGRFGQS